MPHSCVKCKEVFPDQSEAILKGCSCGSRIFYFIKPDQPAMQAQQPPVMPTEQELGPEIMQLSLEKSVVIQEGEDGPENIRVLEPGSYELNVASLFKGDPVILRTDAEVYYVKLPKPSERKKI